MKKALLILAVLTAFMSLASATITPVPSNKWYTFPTVSTSVSVDKAEYSPGDELGITATVFNNGAVPLSGGALRAHVIYLDDRSPPANSTSPEEYLLDEFFISEDVNLLPGDNASFAYTWKLPAGALAGNYRAAVYLSEAKMFNLDGVSFLRGVYGDVIPFKVSGGSDLLHFDTAKLTIDGRPQSLHAPSAPYFPGKEIPIRIPLMNEGSATKAEIIYEVYSWDDMKAENKKTAYKESVSLAAGESKTLALNVPAEALPDAYLAKITVTSPKNKAIVKIRVPVLGKSIQMNFAGLDGFPLKKGREVALFMVASNSAESGMGFMVEDGDFQKMSGGIKGGAMKLSLEAGGKTLFEDSLQGAILSGAMQGYEVRFTPDADYAKVTLKAEAADEAGNKDSAEITYDLNKLARKLDVSLGVSVEKDTAKLDIGLSAFGFPMKGDVRIYVADQDGMPGFVESAHPNGTYTMTVSNLKAGSYTAIVTEERTGSRAEKEFGITYVPPTPQPAGGDGTGLILVLLAILVIAAVLFVKRKDVQGLLGRPKPRPKGKGGQSAAATAAKLKKLK